HTPPIPTLFPYTTLFRSRLRKGFDNHGDALTAADTGGSEPMAKIVTAQLVENGDHETRARSAERMTKGDRTAVHIGFVTLEAERSEEHTSELQSLAYLVC